MIIYKITNTINGKIYIGQTVGTLDDRWSDHSRPHRGKNKARSAIAAAIKKYGKENFKIEVIQTASSLEELNSLEASLIASLGSLSPNGYNLERGGYNKECHPETRLKIAATLKGRPIKNRQNGAKPGRPCTWGSKISKTMTGVAQPWKYKAVVCNETGVVYESVQTASKETGIERTALMYLLKSGGKTRNTRLSFSYVDVKALASSSR